MKLIADLVFSDIVRNAARGFRVGATLFQVCFCLMVWRSEPVLGNDARQEITQGPIRITADETESKDKGRIIKAQGNVTVKYQLESGDTVNSVSKFARYDQNEELGEIWGSPRAVWKRKELDQPETFLTADKIALRVKGSQLSAQGNVEVAQSSRTLKAQEIRYFGEERKMVAETGRPAFHVMEPRHRIQISAEHIVGWMDKREIQFSQKVKGRVEFTQAAP